MNHSPSPGIEPYAREQFTRAIEMCGDDPEYENTKEFMQDMIDEGLSVMSKNTPVHITKYMYTAACNPKFTREFRECINAVLFARDTEDKSTTFLLRKLKTRCDALDELVQNLYKRISQGTSENYRVYPSIPSAPP